MREMANVLKDTIECKTNGKMRLESPIMQWLIRWSAMLLSRYKVGKDGKLHMKDEEDETATLH